MRRPLALPLLLLAGGIGAQTPKLAVNRAAEPAATAFDLSRAFHHARRAATAWREKQSCVTCHTNGLFLLAGDAAAPGSKAHRDNQAFARDYLSKYVVDGRKRKGQRGAIEGLVATTAFLTISESGAKALHPTTRRAFDHILKAQDAAGHWPKWLKCGWPPFEVDDHFGVALATLALARAPASYRRTRLARAGMRRLRAWLRRKSPRNLHQKGMRLWVGRYATDVVAAKERKAWVRELVDRQQKSGGWALADLGAPTWKKHEPRRSAADAYATAFAIYVLRQAGLPADAKALQRGLVWLERDQRESGRWHVRSPRRDRHHYISQAATNFALLAFTACGRRVAGKPKK